MNHQEEIPLGGNLKILKIELPKDEEKVSAWQKNRHVSKKLEDRNAKITN
jgi:hypothetical protein